MKQDKISDEEKRAAEYKALKKREEEILELEIRAFAELLLDIYEWRQKERKKKSDPSGSSPAGAVDKVQ